MERTCQVLKVGPIFPMFKKKQKMPVAETQGFKGLIERARGKWLTNLFPSRF